jgi:serine/threonine-protein kinase
VHRDLKPDNIMLARNRDGSDCVKVVDFGIAKSASNAVQKVTRTGLVVGTPAYMSPEQLAGDKLDGRSDEYALALVAFNMLTGQLPFPSETAQESMLMRLTERPKSLRDMKPDVAWSRQTQAVLDRALARDAKGRFPTASGFGAALYEAVTEMTETAELAAARAGVVAADAPRLSVPATRVAAAEPVLVRPSTGPLSGRRRAPILVGGVAALLLLGGAVYAVRRGRANEVRPAAAGVQAAGPAATPPATRVADAPGRAESGPVNPATARQAERVLGTYRSKVRTRADSAALALIAAKAALLTGGAAQGCGILRRIDPSALTGKMKAELIEGLQTCEGS